MMRRASGVPPETGARFTGSGFAMRAVIDAIHEAVGNSQEG